MSSYSNGYKYVCDMCGKEEIMTINSLPEYWDHFYFCFQRDNKVSTHWDICSTCNPFSRTKKSLFQALFLKLKKAQG